MRDFGAEKRAAVRQLRKQIRQLIAGGLVIRVPWLRNIEAQLEEDARIEKLYEGGTK